MAKKRPTHSVTPSGSKGAPLTLDPTIRLTRRSMRGIMKDVVSGHSTELAYRIREGLLSENLRLSLKYITLVSAYESGKPVETHRMVGLQEGPQGAYDLSKLPPKEQKALLKLLRAAKDTTTTTSET